jgi:hypothetical protein
LKMFEQSASPDTHIHMQVLAKPIWIIWFSRSHTCKSIASDRIPSGCDLALRRRQKYE